MKTYAALNKFLGKVDARLIDVKLGLQAERNPNGTISLRMKNKTIVKFGKTKDDVILNTGRELTPSMLRLLNKFNPYEIKAAKGHWFVEHEMGFSTNLLDGRKIGYQFKDGIHITETNISPGVRFDVYEILSMRKSIDRFAKRFVAALTKSTYPGLLTAEQYNCIYCGVKVNKSGTLGEIDPRHLNTHIAYNQFIVPLLCRAVEVSSPKHRDDAIIALDKYMDKPKKELYAPNITTAERALLTKVLKNYVLLSLGYPITSNGI